MGKIEELPNKIKWNLRLKIASSLYNRMYAVARILKTKVIKLKTKQLIKEGNYHIVQYDDLVKSFGSDLSKVLPDILLFDIIPYDLDTALIRYDTSFQNLKYIKEECDKRNIKLYFSSYPYPWMVSVSESIPAQLQYFKNIYDFRKNRVHPDLMDIYSKKLGVPHLNAYPVFEKEDGKKRYGDYDTHFNSYGYSLYTEFLFESIKQDVLNIISKS